MPVVVHLAPLPSTHAWWSDVSVYLYSAHEQSPTEPRQRPLINLTAPDVGNVTELQIHFVRMTPSKS